MNRPKATRIAEAHPGFALIVTLTLMILLSILAVGLLGLSSVALRSTSQGDAQAEARANARMALIMAIGELQREMGVDSRISAPHDAGSTTGGQPHWVAVYDAWKWNADPVSPETPGGRKPEFRKWLVSGANGGVTSGESATLVGTGTLGDSGKPEERVSAPLQNVMPGNRRGAYGWWFSDESTKAKVNAGPDPATGGDSNPLLLAQAASNVNQKAIPALSGFDWKDGQRAISVSTSGLTLAAGLNPGDLGSTFHDITVHSAGVLADVRAGRLKRDISQLLSRPAEQMEGKPLYISNGTMNRFDISADGDVANASYIPTATTNTAREWGINLEELHLFHNIHRELDWSGGQPSLTMRNSREQAVRDRHYIYKRPVIEAVQFILSLKAEPFQGNHRMVMMLDGMVALSNPNDVPIIWPAGLILPVQLQNIPYDLKWNITDKNQQTKNTNTAGSANFGLFVGRVGGGTTQQATGFRLEPGEAAVFGSTSGSGAQLDLFRGFKPSGGVRVNASAGNGWDLKATGLKTDDNIDFTLTKGDIGFSGNHTYYNAWIGDRRNSPGMGWQIDATLLSSSGDINTATMNKLLISPIRAPQVRPVSDFITKPQPVMMISFLRNVEQTTGVTPPDAIASRPFYLNEPSSAGRGLAPSNIDTTLHTNQTLITAEPLNYQFRTLAAGPNGGSIYHGGGRQPNLGGSFNVVKRRLPIAPPLSFGAFENAIACGLNKRFGNMAMGPGLAIGGDPFPSDAVALTGHNPASPNIAKAIGNSWSNPFIPDNQVHIPPGGGQRTAADHSWMANTALWDAWFLSGITDASGVSSSSWFNDSRRPRDQFSDLAKGTGTLRNKRFLFFAHKPVEEALESLFQTSGEFKPSAINQLPNYLMVDGAFNVNSTSADAWAAFLSSVRDQELLTGNGAKQAFEHPFGTLGFAVNTALTGTAGDWTGFRSLSGDEIKGLAESIVTEVKARGPFLSLADFVNRRPDSAEATHRSLGALQSAIQNSGLNNLFTGGDRDAAGADFDPLAGAANITNEPYPARSIGASGHLSQAAILTAFGSQITVRGDTFLIRTYGDSRNADGDIVAKAWCEAVVQRTPEYVDPTNAPEAQEGWPQPSGGLSATNSLFGRRFDIISFRWLHADEV